MTGSEGRSVTSGGAPGGGDPLEYYAGHGVMTDPQEYAGLLGGLPTKVDELVGVVQGLMVHVHWAPLYGLALTEERTRELQLRSAAEMLRRIVELDGRPLTVARPLEKKLVGNCRDHTVLLCAMLRQHGVPARARCGFGAYFAPRHYEDHWVCEYWNSAEGRWVLVDAQLDQSQREELEIRFDVLDVPHDEYIVAGRAWQWCRTGQADPDQFGVVHMHGMPFVTGNLVRDLLALNRIEILPWDEWGLMDDSREEIPESDLAVLDTIADATLGDNRRWPEVRALFETDPRLHTYPEWLQSPVA